MQVKLSLSETERALAQKFVRQGKANARTLTRAWILLKLADGWDEAKVAETFTVTRATVKNVAQRFVEGGLDLVLHADVQPPVPVEPGQPERVDYEYERRGTRNLFVVVEPLAGWRHVEVTEQRTMHDYAKVVRWLVDEVYPQAESIRLVQDNLNTHTPASLYETFPPAEARRIVQRLEFHSTPKHGSPVEYGRDRDRHPATSGVITAPGRRGGAPSSGGGGGHRTQCEPTWYLLAMHLVRCSPEARAALSRERALLGGTIRQFRPAQLLRATRSW